MDGKMRILILEDRASDAELVKFCLTEAGFIFVEKCVTNREEFLKALDTFQPDLILSDYDLPDYNGASALGDARKIFPRVPFILVTGAFGENETRINEMLRLGANACVLKDNLDRLPTALAKYKIMNES